MQVQRGGEDVRVMVAGYTPGRLGGPAFLVAGRPIAPRAAIIVVTHDEKIIPTFRCIYHNRDGKTYEEAGEGRSL